MKKVKLTEADLTRIVKRIMNEDDNTSDLEINNLVDGYQNKYDEICHEISRIELDSLYVNYNDIIDEIDDIISILDGIKEENENIVILHDDYTELKDKINQIMVNIDNCYNIKNTI